VGVVVALRLARNHHFQQVFRYALACLGAPWGAVHDQNLFDMRNYTNLSHRRLVVLACVAFTACFWLSVTPRAVMATEGAPIRCKLSFAQRATHYVDVRMTVEVDPAADELQLFMPVWTPGSYLVRDYARHVDQLVAVDDQASRLPIHKNTKSSWVVKKGNAKRVVLTYSVYCNELSVRTNFVDAEFGILNGAATFLTCQGMLGEPHEVEIELPEGWKRSVTSMPKARDGKPHRYLANNFDHLVDSPILVGNPSLYPFTVGGVEHYLVNQGGDEFWDGETAAADATRIVAEHQRMWGNIPYDRYYFLNVIAESGGGLEHDNSTLLMTSRWSYRAPKSYKRWLGLVSHEFFHAWNVRRLRPQALEKYDYLGENYFDELWVAEGITSYYDELALVRCGLISQKEYLEALSGQIKSLQTTPGRERQSLQQSSHDAWIKFYRPDENSANSSISYYTKGAVVAFLLDAEIRQRTNNAQSLDDVMRGLWADFAEQQRGYTNADVLAVVERLTKTEFAEWFERAIFGTEELNYDTALDLYGLRFKSQNRESPAEADKTESEKTTPDKPVDSGDKVRGSEANRKKQAQRISLGLSAEASGGMVTVRRVNEGTSASAAGVNVGDELIAIDGYRLSGGLDSRLEQYRPGQTIKLLVARRGKLLELDLFLTADNEESWSLEPLKEPTELQQEHLRDWLRLIIKDEPHSGS
jgi:predicted metalloprotease with PDZ domain